MTTERLDPQQFRMLAGGTLAQRHEALGLLIRHGLATTTGVPGEQEDEEPDIKFTDTEHPCVRIFIGTRSRQGVT